MTKKELYTRVLSYFRELHPEVTTELEFGSVFQLLVAVVLSVLTSVSIRLRPNCLRIILMHRLWLRLMSLKFMNM